MPMNCYNAGKVFGGILAPITIGNSNTITGEMINCYCLEECKPIPNDGGYITNEIAIYLTSKEMKEGASLLGDAFCQDDEGINKGYPILKWQKNINKE